MASEDRVTVATAASVLTEYGLDGIRQMAASGTPWLSELSREWNLTEALAEPFDAAAMTADARLLDAVEVAFLGLLLTLRLLQVRGGALLRANVAKNADRVRQGLRDPALRLAIRIDQQGHVSVRPCADVEHDRDAFVGDLGEIRAHIDALIAKHRGERIH